MRYFFKGSICGRLCDNCEEALSNVQVRLYRIREDQPEISLAAARPKNTFTILFNEQVQAKEKYLLAEAQTDSKGSFSVEMGEDLDYNGEAFEIDVRVGRAPGQEERPEGTTPVQFTINTLQPQWRKSEEGPVAAWEHCISHRFWCKVREQLGAYVICGQVLKCGDVKDPTRETRYPLPNMRVTAFDRDWIQDDPLGSAVTDSDGHFRIYYSPDQFEEGTFIDVELIGGPDLYFKVETSMGSSVLEEAPSKGRESGRENAGACFCTELCVDEEVAPPPPPAPKPFFSHIGHYEYETEINSSVPGNGFTVGSGRAFFRNLRLNGTLAKTKNGSPMEYRFEVREVDASGNPISGNDWEPVKVDQLGHTKIGVLQKGNPDFPGSSSNPIRNLDYVIGSADSNEKSVNIVDGWIRVPQESGNPLGSTGLFTPNHNLIQLNTRKLVPHFQDIDLNGLQTGNSSTSTGKALADNRHFALRMKTREVGDTGSGDVAGTCKHIAINNTLYDNINSHPDWHDNNRSNQLAVAMVDIAQLQGDGCSEIEDKLDVLFTAAHPNLGDVNISMKGGGTDYDFDLPSPSTPGDQYGTADPKGFKVTDLSPCAYIVDMSVGVLLTTGDHTPDDLNDEIAFCKS